MHLSPYSGGAVTGRLPAGTTSSHGGLKRCDPKGDMTQRSDLFEFKASALSDDDTWHRNQSDFGADADGAQLDREERSAMRRVPGLSTELQDITELEYRQLRLERVVLCGVWTEGTVEDADNSIRELAALAETAGSTVLAGLIQRRQKPDTSTFLGSGKAIELRDVVIAEGADTVVATASSAPDSDGRSRTSSRSRSSTALP